MDSPDNKTDDPSQSAALRPHRVFCVSGQRSEEEILQAKEALERRTEELAHSISMMRATLDSTTDAIVVTDEEGAMTDFNEKYIEMLGIPRDLNRIG